MSQLTVTAVMITGHDPRRRPLALHTARSFQQQTYGPAELLVLNQGAERLLPQPIPRVREVQAGAGLVVGALRNLAWQFANGDAMTCWDDDDVHHPERIALQVAEFVSCPVALQNELYLHLDTGKAFVYSRRGGFENTLLWPRACRSRYPEEPRGSDTTFRERLWQELGGIVRIDNPPRTYVRLFHGRNIWPEDHFFDLPQRLAADPRNRGIRTASPSEDDRRYLDQLWPVYRELVS